jgi:hypothetical protein
VVRARHGAPEREGEGAGRSFYRLRLAGVDRKDRRRQARRRVAKPFDELPAVEVTMYQLSG